MNVKVAGNDEFVRRGSSKKWKELNAARKNGVDLIQVSVKQKRTQSLETEP